MLSDFLGAITLGLRSYKGYLAKPSVTIRLQFYWVPDNNNSKKKSPFTLRVLQLNILATLSIFRNYIDTEPSIMSELVFFFPEAMFKVVEEHNSCT